MVGLIYKFFRWQANVKQLAYQTGLVFQQKSQAANQTIPQTDNNENFASVTELVFAISPGTWQFKFDLYLNHNSASNGYWVKSAALFSGTTSIISYTKRMHPIGSYSISSFTPGLSARADSSTSAVPTTNGFTLWHSVEGVLVATSSGNLSPRFGKSTGNYTSYNVTCYAGSRAYIYQVD